MGEPSESLLFDPSSPPTRSVIVWQIGEIIVAQGSLALPVNIQYLLPSVQVFVTSVQLLRAHHAVFSIVQVKPSHLEDILQAIERLSRAITGTVCVPHTPR